MGHIQMELSRVHAFTMLSFPLPQCSALIDWHESQIWSVACICKQKFYWNICLCIGYGCFCSTTAKLNSCDRDLVSHKAENICYLAIYRKILAKTALDIGCLLSEDIGEQSLQLTYNGLILWERKKSSFKPLLFF